MWTKTWSTHPPTLKKTHEPAMNKIYEQISNSNSRGRSVRTKKKTTGTAAADFPSQAGGVCLVSLLVHSDAKKDKQKKCHLSDLI